MDPDERKELLEQELVRREHAIAKMLADKQVASLKHQLGKVPKAFHSTYAYLVWWPASCSKSVAEHTRKY